MLTGSHGMSHRLLGLDSQTQVVVVCSTAVVAVHHLKLKRELFDV